MALTPIGTAGVAFGSGGVGFAVSNSYPLYATGPTYDPAAQAFITRADLTDTAQKMAINQLAVDFRAAGFFAAGKSYAYWPVVGGTAATHALNLFNVDAFPLVFPAGFIHETTGCKSTAGTIASTGFVGSRDLVGDTLALAFYSRTDDNANWDMGTVETQMNVQGLIIRRGNGLSASDIGNDNTYAGRTETDGRGLFIGSRTSPTAHALYKNGAVVASNTVATPMPMQKSATAYGLCGAAGGSGSSSARQCAGAGIFAGLSATEAQTLYDAVQKFNTALGRQV